MDLDFVSVHKNAKRELGHHPAILTSRLVNNIYILTFPFLQTHEKLRDMRFSGFIASSDCVHKIEPANEVRLKLRDSVISLFL